MHPSCAPSCRASPSSSSPCTISSSAPRCVRLRKNAWEGPCSGSTTLGRRRATACLSGKNSMYTCAGKHVVLGFFAGRTPQIDLRAPVLRAGYVQEECAIVCCPVVPKQHHCVPTSMRPSLTQGHIAPSLCCTFPIAARALPSVISILTHSAVLHEVVNSKRSRLDGGATPRSHIPMHQPILRVQSTMTWSWPTASAAFGGAQRYCSKTRVPDQAVTDPGALIRRRRPQSQGRAGRQGARAGAAALRRRAPAAVHALALAGAPAPGGLRRRPGLPRRRCSLRHGRALRARERARHQRAAAAAAAVAPGVCLS